MAHRPQVNFLIHPVEIIIYILHPTWCHCDVAALATGKSSYKYDVVSLTRYSHSAFDPLQVSACTVHGATRRKHSLVAALLTVPMTGAMKTPDPLVWGTMKVDAWAAAAAAEAAPHPDAIYASCRHPTPNTACRWSPAYTSLLWHLMISDWNTVMMMIMMM